MLEINKIHNIDALNGLKQLPNESISCVVTSPPYWGLREYNLSPLIWDGDADCKHDFEIRKYENPRAPGSFENAKVGNSKKGLTKFNITEGFCIKCGAWKGQLGQEPTFKLFLKHLCDIFDEVKRVLRKDGCCFVNLGDSYSGSNGNGWKQTLENNNIFIGKSGYHDKLRNRVKCEELPNKSLCNIPARFSIEMQDRGWILRNVIIWHKPNCMPSSADDRFTVDFEYVFFFVKSKKYFFEQQLEKLSEISLNDKRLNNGRYIYNGKLKEQQQNAMCGFNSEGRNKRCVWTITTKPFNESHFATFPKKLIEPMIKAGCPEFVCIRCGKPREKIYKYNNIKTEGHGILTKKDEPYSVQHRKGEILVRDLPPEQEIINYLRKYKNNITYKEISEKTGLAITSVSHWFSDIDSTHGFSYPSKNEWIKLKELLQFDDIYDIAMTTEYYKPADVMNNQYKEIGYTDCGCGANFEGGICMDPFMGAGTTALVSKKLNRNYIGFELNKDYIQIANKRLFNDLGLFNNTNIK